jgi:hypothetical protein
MKRLLFWGAALGVATAAGAANYTLSVSTIYETDAASAEVARAFGIPGISRVDTTATFSLEPLDGGAYRLTFATASQQTLAGESVIPDVEKVAGLLPGRWLEFAPWSMREGGVKRAPALAKDSEEISYNLLGLMLFPPGGPLAGAWRDSARPAVARSYGMSIVSLEYAEAQPLPPFEGQEDPPVEFSVVFAQTLSQSTNFSEMTGKASFEGIGAAVAGAGGLPAYARLDLSGKRDRSFIIAGKQRDLGEHVSLALRLVREGQELPAEWALTEEITAE